MPPRPPHSTTRRAFLASAGIAGTLAGCLSRLPVGGEAPRSTDETTCSTSLARPPHADANTWPMAGHDAGATRHNPAIDATSSPGEPAWTQSLPQSHLPTDPAVGPVRLYVCIGNHEPTPPKMRVAAFSLEDGSRQWERPLTYADDATPTLAGDGTGRLTLFVVSGQDNSSTGPGTGEVLALDPASGERRWRWTIDRKLAGPPVVADGRIFVHNTSYGKSALHVLDAASGEELWTVRTGPVLHHAPTVAGERVFVSRDRHRLAALRVSDGTVEWVVETNADDMRPVVDAARGHVLMGHPKGLEAFCAASGERAWHLVTTGAETSEKAYQGVIRGPVVTEDWLFVQTSDTSPSAIGDPGKLHGVDPATGTVQWTLEEGRPASHALGANGVAIVARSLPGESSGTGSRRQPVSDVAAIGADGSVLWTSRGTWRPVALGAGSLLAYRGHTEGISSQVDIACFEVG